MQCIGTPESGGNVGSEFQLYRCSDAGAAIDAVINIARNNPGVAIKGTNTNDDAAGSYVGEYAETSVTSSSSISVGAAAWTNFLTLSLTAGDWDVWATVNNLTACQIIYCSLSTASGTPDPSSTRMVQRTDPVGGIGANNTICLQARFKLAASGTIYVVVYNDVANQFWGGLAARRRR
jgi:hypothetical protein